MNQLAKAFEYSGIQVRTQVVDSEPWFCLADVGEVLGMKNYRHFLNSDYCDGDGVQSLYTTDSIGREQETTFISEANLYAIVMRSTKAEAKAFSRWVTHEVLPTLRKTGTYTTAPVSDDPILATLTAITQMRQEQIARFESVENRLERLEAGRARAGSNVAALPMPSVEAPEITEREACRRLVEKLAGITGVGFPFVWREAYRTYEMTERVSLAAQTKKAKLEKLDWIDKHGNIGVLHSILKRMHIQALKESERAS